MLVGHNLLEGKIVNLAKPLAILKKKETRISSETSTAASYSPATIVKTRGRRSDNDKDELMDVDEDEDRDSDQGTDSDEPSDEGREFTRKRGLNSRTQAEAEATTTTTGVEYDLVALVKRKLLFSKRPMPVVNMVQTSRTFPGKQG